ncbi:uracil-DNA glycosylase family protein [Gemmobacter sp. 24YEA27]|uniref:uracil-DNA glycosylase family protein n=1 Tax=Gemmobacter sp. 24YEA27 TaxID=3040672 RepID=UPI0032C48D8F
MAYQCGKAFQIQPARQTAPASDPDRQEILHCRWWLGLELSFIRPDLVLALGATAALALTGRDDPMTARRGQIETGLHGGPVLITWHPSAILRQGDPEARARMTKDLAADIATARHHP